MRNSLIMGAHLHPWLEIGVRVCLAGVFLYAAVGKLGDPEGFARVIGGYGLAPQAALLPLAVALPALEVLAALGLLLNYRGALSLYVGLLLLFILVLGHGIRLGLDVDCGCYGPGDPEGEAYHGLWSALLRDCLLLLVCGYIYVWRKATGRGPRPLPLLRSGAEPIPGGRTDA
ncbi:MAG: MauE/DoxX family redox-associated membrane protein [Desulfovibrio sp.]